MQIEQIFPDLVCNNLWQAALLRIELFVTGRTIPFNSRWEDPAEPFQIAERRRKANSQKGQKAQKGAERTNRPNCSDPGPVAAGWRLWSTGG